MMKSSGPAALDVEMLTCSTASDLELFAPLAASVDRHVDPRIRHIVVVPAVDMKEFRPFTTARREIVAQEDILPFRVWKSPRILKRLAGLRAGFRRPVYLTPKGRIMRGWMLQQFLKIEMCRRSQAAAVMHVDSDVCFVRSFEAEDAFEDGKPTFFRVEGETRNPRHRDWVEGSCTFLGVAPPENHKAHYIENGVLWGVETCRAMVKRIEATHGMSLMDVIMQADTMSEYYLYGLFADLFPEGNLLAEQETSYCNSFWPDAGNAAVTCADFMNRLQPKHRAIAVQSTHDLTLDTRLALYREVEEHLKA